MRLGVLAFLAGILLLHSLPELPTRAWAALLPATAALALIPPLRLPAWGATGLLWALWLASPPMASPEDWEGAELWVEGWIATLPDREWRHTRFEFVVDRARRGERPIAALAGRRLRLAWWDDGEAEAEARTPDPRPMPRAGDRWGFMIRLKAPRGLLNPGGFDYERHLYAQGIAATGAIRPQPPPQRLIPAERYPLDRYRQRVADSFARLLPDHPFAGVLTALTVGEEGGISPAQWDVFNRTGVGHLMSISGSHIGLVAGLLFGLVWTLWSRVPPCIRYWPAPRAAALAALLGAGAYTLLSGLSVPAQRSWLMAAVAMTALILQRPAAPSRVLALALGVVLAVDPAAPLRVGFWLSFGAVAAILYTVSGRWRRRWLGQTVGLQLNLTLALLPATLMFFQQFPLLSPLTNLIAIPWVGCTVLPLSLLAALLQPFGDSVQAPPLHLAALTMEGLWQVLVWFDDLPHAVLYRPAPPWWTLAFALPGVALLLAPRGLPGRWLGLPLLLPLLWPPASAPEPGGFWFTLLDVGQGLAAVVRTQRHVLVYDTGSKLGTTLDAGRAVLAPFLRQQGAVQVDALIVSHNDAQHTGGVRSLRQLLPVRRILTSSPERTPIDGAEPCRAGQTWEWDGVRFEILYPSDASLGGDNASCVLKVASAAGQALLPGDIETAAETALAATQGAKLAADVLIAPHHGHRAPATAAFLNAARPRYVLFSTGYRNRFGYPRPDTVARYQTTGAVLLNTADEGALTFRFAIGHPLELESYRRRSRRYWNAP